MKKIFSLAIFATVLLCFNEADAKIRRVGYFGTPVTGTDYADLQSAHDAASAKDTIMLYPNPTGWSAKVSKKIIVLGYGYFLTGDGANGNLQNVTGSLSVTISLYAGADSSVYEGLDNLYILAVTAQTVNKVIIRRCNANINFNDKTLDSWQILQSNIKNLSYYYYNGNVTNLRVDNCYIDSWSFYKSGTYLQTGQFTNDIFYAGSDFSNGSFLIKNCILLRYHYNDANCVYRNSIANSGLDTIPVGNGNQNITNAAMENNVFVGYYYQTTYSNDGRWVLKDGSPAKGKGEGGTDVGIFGGTNPYKLSGIPRTPSFYKLTAPSTTTSSNPYTITFSVRSNN